MFRSKIITLVSLKKEGVFIKNKSTTEQTVMLLLQQFYNFSKPRRKSVI